MPVSTAMAFPGKSTTIFTCVAAERSELKPGASVDVNGIVDTGSGVEASRTIAGRGGAIPR